MQGAVNRLAQGALNNVWLNLANKVAPVISASILTSYVLFKGKTVGIITLSNEQSEAIVRARNGGELSPLSHWRTYFWGKE